MHARYHAPMSRRSSSDQFELPAAARLRIDKWLWAARFFKTRGLAQDAVEGGRVRILGFGGDQHDMGDKGNIGERIKPSREVRLGDLLHIQIGDLVWRVSVRGLSDHRGPAPVARELYEESPESIAARQTQIEARRAQMEPGSSIRGRPTKKDRRLIHRFTE
jgi:ribosome-associated heat shock protein Hsp15